MRNPEEKVKLRSRAGAACVFLPVPVTSKGKLMNLDIIGIGTALAADGAPAQQSGLGMVPMLIGFLLIFYFLMIRPQSKRAKEQRNLLSKLSVDDEVITTAGLAGKITQVGDSYIKLEIAKHVEITIQKAAITGMLPKGTLSQGTLLEVKPAPVEQTKESKEPKEK